MELSTNADSFLAVWCVSAIIEDIPSVTIVHSLLQIRGTIKKSREKTKEKTKVYEDVTEDEHFCEEKE